MIRLSRQQREALTGAINVLQAPHRFPSMEQWRVSVFERLHRVFAPQPRGAGQAYPVFETADALGNALLLCDADGRPLHRTPSLHDLLRIDPARAAIETGLQNAAAAVAAQLDASAPGSLHQPAPVVHADLRTRSAKYHIRASLLRVPGSRPWIIAALERLTRKPAIATDLQRRHGLTPAESRVAVLLAAGDSNAAIARALGLRESTVRRHTERIFLKLGVRSRAEAAARL